MRTLTATWTGTIAAKLGDYAQLVKFRLSAVVVFSALAGYAVAAAGHYDLIEALLLSVGGLLITASANAMNEYIERDTDRLMARTADRPLPAGRMSAVEAILASGIMAVSGLSLIGLYFNEVAALVGAVALISYAFLYTPLKKSGPIAVWIGAIPGALPPVIGYVCVTGQLTSEAIVLFVIQFLWQFVHFWAIAWLADADYAKAGFRMLPAPGGKDRSSTVHMAIFSILLASAGLLPWAIGLVPLWASIILVGMALPVVIYSLRLVADLNDKSARKMLYASFIYLPLALILIVAA